MLTFLHISDTHISGDPTYSPFGTPETVPHPNRGVEALIEAIGQLPFPYDFILHTGDVCADPKTEDYQRARELLSQLRQPVYFLPGNHDSAQLLEDSLHDGKGLQVLRDAAVQESGYQLLALDTYAGGDSHAPSLLQTQIDWFDAQMKSLGEGPVIIAVHHPLIETGVPWIDEKMRVQNGDAIQRILKLHRGKVAGVFHGHIHQVMTTVSDGIAHISCQSTWSNLAAYPGLIEDEADPRTPGGFNLVVAEGNRSFVRRYSLPRLAG